MSLPAKLVRIILGMAICLFVVELVVQTQAHRLQVPHFQSQMISGQQENSRNLNGSYDQLIFGDSTSVYAIDPEILETETGLSTYHFGNIGDLGMVSNYYLLKNYLKNNKYPKHLYLMMGFESWQKGVDSKSVVNNLRRHYPSYLLYLPQVIELNLNTLKCLTNLLQNTLSSQIYGSEILNLCNRWLGTSETLNPTNVINQVPSLSTALTIDKGSYRKSRDQYESIEEKLDHLSKVKQYDWAQPPSKNPELKPIERILDRKRIHKPYLPSRLNRYFLMRFIKLAKENHVKIFLVHPPMLNRTYYEPGNNQKISSYLLMMRDLAKDPNITLITSDLHPVGIEKLYDSEDHLTNEESGRFTKKIADLYSLVGK